jgi:hypothetical protein
MGTQAGLKSAPCMAATAEVPLSVMAIMVVSHDGLESAPCIFNDAVQSCRPVTVTLSRPFLRSIAPVMAGAATSQRTAAVPAMAPGTARLSLHDQRPQVIVHGQPRVKDLKQV